MKKRTVLAALCIISCLTSFAKNSQDWKGKVLDENGEPLPYVNVALLAASDSTVLGGATTDIDGTFTIATDRADGIIMAAMIGYRTQYLKPSDGLTIQLEPETEFLQSAVATAVMPKTKLTGEGLQTSVRGSVLENAGNALDVLGKTPGIIKGQDGIEVIGKGSPLVYINGHKVTDSGELERLRSNEIQSIEVISNPGAQYSASVRSVVRIRTIKRQGEGFGFNATLEDAQSLRIAGNNDPNLNVNANYRKNNVDIFAGGNAFRVTHQQKSDELHSETVGSPSYKSEGWLINDIEQRYLYGNAGLNWQIADNHSVGVKAEYGHTLSLDQNQVLYNNMLREGAPYDETTTLGIYHIGDKAPSSLSANAYYNGQAGKLGIDLNVDLYKMKKSEANDITEINEKTKEENLLHTDNGTDSDLYASKLVFSYPIWQGQLQFGTEETFSRISDSYSITGTSIAPAESKVSEDNIAAFASYAFVLPKFGQISAGLRYEHVNYSFTDVLGDGSDSRKYDNLFPSLSIAGQIGKVQVMASYSAKTSRPGFNLLSSAVRYNSKFIIQSGNPALQPQTINDANVMASWKWLTFVADWARNDGVVSSWSTRYNDDGVIIVKPRNLDKPLRVLATYIVATPTIKNFNLNYTVGVQQQWLTMDIPDPREADGTRTASFNDKPMFIAQLHNTYTTRNGWQFELGSEIHSRAYSANVMLTNVYFDLNAAIQKSLLKDNSLVLRLSGSDLAGLGLTNAYADYGSHFIRQSNRMDTQRVTLSVRYSFNSAQSKYKGTGAGKDAISRMK